MESRKIVIVGGVAGGASAAAKARRTDEKAEIVIFEKGSYMSFANCGLPYYIGGEIKNRDKLILQTPKKFKERFNVDVKLNHEVFFIDRNRKIVKVLNRETGRQFEESFDKLILAPGAQTFKPPIPGLDADNVFYLRTIPDAENIHSFIGVRSPGKAVVIGAGYIGLEAAEALKNLGMEVSIVEMLPQALTLFDSDIAAYVHREIMEWGVDLNLSDGVKEIAKNPDGIARMLVLQSGKEISADIIVAALGVRPNSRLALQAGLDLGSSGAIKVNKWMETSDPDIYAVGDVVETPNLLAGKFTWLPLAGPANKQGRVAGANAAGGNLTFGGVLGTAIVRFHNLTAGKVGFSEAEAQREGFDYFTTRTHSLSHAGYYPGGEMLHTKIIVAKNTGKVLGAQVVGGEGVDKRIDVFATAIYFGATVTDLANLELSYAPPFGSAKDPVNIAGMTAENRLMGIEKFITYEEFMKNPHKYYLLDVRSPGERKYEPATIHSHFIPLEELRARMDEIPRDRPIVTCCRAGYRGYVAQRIMEKYGYEVYNFDGGRVSNEMIDFDASIPRSALQRI